MEKNLIDNWVDEKLKKIQYKFKYKKYKSSDVVMGNVYLSSHRNVLLTSIFCNSTYDKFMDLTLYRNFIAEMFGYSHSQLASDETLNKFKDNFLNWMTEKKFNSYVKRLKTKQNNFFEAKIDEFFYETFKSMQHINQISLKDYKDYLNKSIKKFETNEILSS